MNSYLWQGNSELRNQPLTKQSTTSVLHCHKDEYLRITSTAILFPPFSRHHEERAKQRQQGQQKTQRTFPAHTRQRCQNNSAVPWMHIWNGKRQRWTRCRVLSVHSTGIHTASPASAARAAVKVEKVRRPTVSAVGSSEEWSYFLTLELRAKTASYNYLNVATNSYARPNKEHRRLANK